MPPAHARLERPRRRLAVAVVLAVCALAAIPGVMAAMLDNEAKVTVCHRSSSESNPYQSISVPIDKKDGTINGHETHTGPVFPAPDWGDIIPPYVWVDKDGDTHGYPGYNWGDDGQAIWQNGCEPTTPPEPPAPDPITPYVQCIEPHGSGFLAHFGYDNPNSASVTPPQDQNVFDPAPANRSQPTTFDPGHHDDAVAADFSGSLTWKLTGKSATANDSSPRCPGSITVVKHLVPADDPGRFDLKIDGQVRGTGAAVGDQGTTGTISGPAGTHTVSESAASGTSLDDYTIDTVCRNDGPPSSPARTARRSTSLSVADRRSRA